MLNRRELLASAAALTLMPAAAAPADRAASLYGTFVDEMMEASPELATSLGLDAGRKSYLRSRLAKRSPEGRREDKARTAAMLARLKAVDRTALKGLDATNYDAVRYGLEQDDAVAKRFDYGNGSNPYTVYQLGGAYQQVPTTPRRIWTGLKVSPASSTRKAKPCATMPI